MLGIWEDNPVRGSTRNFGRVLFVRSWGIDPQCTKALSFPRGSVSIWEKEHYLDLRYTLIANCLTMLATHSPRSSPHPEAKSRWKKLVEVRPKVRIVAGFDICRLVPKNAAMSGRNCWPSQKDKPQSILEGVLLGVFSPYEFLYTSFSMGYMMI